MVSFIPRDLSQNRVGAVAQAPESYGGDGLGAAVTVSLSEVCGHRRAQPAFWATGPNNRRTMAKRSLGLKQRLFAGMDPIATSPVAESSPACLTT